MALQMMREDKENFQFDIEGRKSKRKVRIMDMAELSMKTSEAVE